MQAGRERTSDHAAATGDEEVRTVDCDVHPTGPSMRQLFPYLSARWKEYVEMTGYEGPIGMEYAYPKGLAGVLNEEEDEPQSVAPIELLQGRVLSKGAAELAILNCYYATESIRNPDLASTLAEAVNTWLREEWLDKDDRLRASIVVDPNYPDLAAREIERAARHKRFVQILLPVRSARPYGNRAYYPIYEAATRNGLAVGIHFGGMPGNPPTSVGWPTHYLEEYVGAMTIFQSQVVSLVVEGTFQRFPTMQVVLLEGGWSWLPSLLWRMDKDWKSIRRETPWLVEAPSTYVRNHIHASLRPLDLSGSSDHLLEVINQIGTDNFLLFSTDFPHKHGDDPEGFFDVIPKNLRRAIKQTNPAAVYNLDRATA